MWQIVKPLLGPAIALTVLVGQPIPFDLPNEENASQESVVYLPYPEISMHTETKFEQVVTSHSAPIPFDTHYLDDPTLELGTETVSQVGRTGTKNVITTEIMYDDVLYESFQNEELVEAPLDQVVLRGTKIVYHSLDSELGPLTYTQKISDVWATSYDSTCPGCSTTTATGMKQGFGVVAVDPTVIPLHSWLYIPGYGKAFAGDVGGAIKGNKIDLGFDSLNGQWRAHAVDVYILSN